MKDIEILTFQKISERSFHATGRIDNRFFESKTIVHKGQPIFKVFEDGLIKTCADSMFTLGERMSIARLLKKYSLGKVDKLGREASDQKNTGIGLVIKLQNQIDDLKSKIIVLESLLKDNKIQLPEGGDE